MSEFWQRKMKTLFRRLDSNGDGFIMKEEFELIAERLGELNKEKSIERKKIVEVVDTVFGYLEKAAGVDGKLNEGQWTEALRKMRGVEEFVAQIRDAADLAFRLLDVNGDDVIQEEEYVAWLKCIQVKDHEKLAKLAFKALDADQDGKVTGTEFRDALVDFYFSDDQKRPGTLAFGPIVD